MEEHIFIKAGAGIGKALLTCNRCGKKKVEPHEHSFWCSQCDYCGEYEKNVKKDGNFYVGKSKYSKDALYLVGYEGNEAASITIPEGITHIGMGHMGSFDGHDEITEVIFSSTLKDTGMHTFSRLKNLKKVVINKGLEQISQSALRCPSLTEIYIPSTVKRIDTGALINDYGLTITCHEDSAVHKYAVEKKIAFKLLPREGE